MATKKKAATKKAPAKVSAKAASEGQESTATVPIPETTEPSSRIMSAIKILADPMRIKILRTLSAGETNVGDICKALSQTQPAVSHHLALLRVSGLVECRREGKRNFYANSTVGQVCLKAMNDIEETLATAGA